MYLSSFTYFRVVCNIFMPCFTLYKRQILLRVEMSNFSLTYSVGHDFFTNELTTPEKSFMIFTLPNLFFLLLIFFFFERQQYQELSVNVLPGAFR